MRATIKDIAKIAKVSASTVSRVLAGNPRISKETATRVLKLIKELNYHPNLIARSLANKSSGVIGVIIPENASVAFRNPFFSELFRGLTHQAHQYGYKILVDSTNDLEEENKAINEMMLSGLVEGIVLLTSRVDDPSIEQLVKANFPFVVVGKPENEVNVNWVDNDNFEIAYNLTKHLIVMGHEHIAFLGKCDNLLFTLERHGGYNKALKDHNIKVNTDYVLKCNILSDQGYELAEHLLINSKKVTAIIACDDLIAFGAMKSVLDRGFRIPYDIAVAGFNNVPLSQYSNPPLTSVDINSFGLGQSAINLLADSIKSLCKSFNREIIPAKLILRRSTVNDF